MQENLENPENSQEQPSMLLEAGVQINTLDEPVFITLVDCYFLKYRSET